MNLQTLQIQMLPIIILALTSLIVLPMPKMALSASSDRSAAGASDSPEGAACDLPPAVEVDNTGEGRRENGSLILDTRVPKKYSTATFAMG